MKRSMNLLAVIVLLNGCGGGSSSSSTEQPTAPSPVSSPSPTPVTTVSVEAHFIKGPVNSATCNLYDFSGGDRGTLLASANTTEQGLADFGTNITATDWGLIECSGGRYIDEFTERSSTTATPMMRTLLQMNGAQGTQFSSVVTPLTEIAVTLTLNDSNSFNTSFPTYSQHVAVAFGIAEGVDISNDIPIDLLNNIISDDSFEAQYGYALALFSYLQQQDANSQWTQVLAIDLQNQLQNGEAVFSESIRGVLGEATDHYLSFGSLINSALQGVNTRRAVMQRGQFVSPEDDTPIKTFSIIKPLNEIRQELAAYITSNNLNPVPAAPQVTDEMFLLGQALAFDKILSGNRDTSCMSCHHPLLASGDARALSLGTGGQGLGQARVGGHVIARHAQPLFNLDLFSNMFWDGRVELSNEDQFRTPAGNQLTPEMAKVFLAKQETDGFTGYGVVSAQALFPVADAHEMRGVGQDNELSQLNPDAFSEIWQRLMNRLGEIDEYVTLFEAAYPNTKFNEMSFAHAANAIAAFEIRGFDFRNNRWQAVIRDVADNGVFDNHELMDENTTRGAHFFFETGCVNCHKGSVMSDFDFHSLAFAQYGPGKGNGLSGVEDFGRENITQNSQDRAKFRTAPLFNVDLTAPYAHLGQFNSLWSHIQTYSIPERFWINLYTGYDRIVGGFVHDPVFNDEVSATERALLMTFPMPSFDGNNYGFIRTLEYIETKLEQAIADPSRLTLEEGKRMGDGELGLHRDILVPFMEAQTDEGARDLSHLIPRTVPSGLEVERRVNR